MFPFSVLDLILSKQDLVSSFYSWKWSKHSASKDNLFSDSCGRIRLFTWSVSNTTRAASWHLLGKVGFLMNKLSLHRKNIEYSQFLNRFGSFFMTRTRNCVECNTTFQKCLFSEVTVSAVRFTPSCKKVVIGRKIYSFLTKLQKFFLPMTTFLQVGVCREVFEKIFCIICSSTGLHHVTRHHPHSFPRELSDSDVHSDVEWWRQNGCWLRLRFYAHSSAK